MDNSQPPQPAAASQNSTSTYGYGWLRLMKYEVKIDSHNVCSKCLFVVQIQLC